MIEISALFDEQENRKKIPRRMPGYLLKLQVAPRYQLHPLVAPQVSHFSHVPFRTIVKFWHSEHMLPV